LSFVNNCGKMKFAFLSHSPKWLQGIEWIDVHFKGTEGKTRIVRLGCASGSLGSSHHHHHQLRVGWEFSGTKFLKETVGRVSEFAFGWHTMPRVCTKSAQERNLVKQILSVTVHAHCWALFSTDFLSACSAVINRDVACTALNETPRQAPSRKPVFYRYLLGMCLLPSLSISWRKYRHFDIKASGIIPKISEKFKVGRFVLGTKSDVSSKRPFLSLHLNFICPNVLVTSEWSASVI
jgi:hypothetical protein